MILRIALIFTCLIPDLFAQQTDSPAFFWQLDEAAVFESPSESPPSSLEATDLTAPIHAIDPQGKLLWLASDIVLPQANRTLVLRIGGMASIEVYWNDNYIGKNGQPAASAPEETPGLIDATFIIPATLTLQGSNRLAIRLSSHHNKFQASAPLHYITIASPDASYTNLFTRYGTALMSMGAFILASVYFGVLAIDRRKNPFALYIALMALFACIQLLSEVSRAFYHYPYPWHFWRLLAILIGASGFSLALCAYINRRFLPNRFLLTLAIASTLVAISWILIPGYDGKTLFALFFPALTALICVVLSKTKQLPVKFAVAATLSVFVILTLPLNSRFLDQHFFLVSGFLILLAFIDQAYEKKRIAAAHEEATSKADQLELELLKRSIAPHALMNTLNALAEWVESEPQTAVKMIEALAGEFRMLSHMASQPLVPLADEVALCRHYISIMSYRTDKTFSVEGQALLPNTQVPPGIIHTLIENAFTHNHYASHGVFKISQSKTDHETRLTLECPAPSSLRPNSGSGGQGLAYIRKRLASTFGDSASLHTEVAATGAWSSSIVIPIRAS
ncbi:histidine kinase [Pelagicoccus sp. SDUM812002]|uniref:sensor histidine kinase n=1 Tax=Pelagicoccus sp. SDUM812002 TaxID=3041266 RepID=UPI00280CA834|nr:histidine kinase [Pelagicoccus sp. SDUM812002]MDQ8186157.1 histidine kinase [Pelagicoccus sp. SDUM812002]